MSQLFLLRLRTALTVDWREVLPNRRDTVIAENALPIYLYVEGPRADTLTSSDFEKENMGAFLAEEGTSRKFSWEPFGFNEKGDRHEGRFAYGFISLHIPGQSEIYFIEIVPSRLSLEQWSNLFQDLCRMGDALLTQWQEGKSLLLGAVGQPASPRFSPATALREIASGWSTLLESLHRIIRRPLMDFRPPRPGMPAMEGDLPDPICSADLYENQLVLQTTRRLAMLLHEIGNRAECSWRADMRRREIYLEARNAERILAEIDQTILQWQMAAQDAHRRAAILNRIILLLPRLKEGTAVRGRIPHVTPRICLHPDYRNVIQWWRAYGRQRFVLSGEEFLSTLPTRRASTLYEFWALFALCAALIQLGYSPQFSGLDRLIRDDFFELEIWRNTPIAFFHEQRQENLFLWYERSARLVLKEPPDKRFRLKREWPEHWQGHHNHSPGLYAQSDPLTPDFWFELVHGNSKAVAVGDAIFSEGMEGRGEGRRATDDVAVKKARRLKEYIDQLVLCRGPNQRAVYPIKHGLLIFCGCEEDVDVIERRCGLTEIEFLPLRPAGEPSTPTINVPAAAIRRLDDFLENMRSNLEV